MLSTWRIDDVWVAFVILSSVLFRFRDVSGFEQQGGTCPKTIYGLHFCSSGFEESTYLQNTYIWYNAYIFYHMRLYIWSLYVLLALSTSGLGWYLYILIFQLCFGGSRTSYEPLDIPYLCTKVTFHICLDSQCWLTVLCWVVWYADIFHRQLGKSDIREVSLPCMSARGR